MTRCPAELPGGARETGDPLSEDASPAEWPISLDELTHLAMSADVDAPLSEGSVSLDVYLAEISSDGAGDCDGQPSLSRRSGLGPLPSWYMPPAIVAIRTRWRMALVIAIVVAFVMIDTFGLCSTYGSVVPA